MENKYIKAHNLEEALKEISCSHAKIIAGGTDLIIDSRRVRNLNKTSFEESLSYNKTLVDISSIQELKSISISDGIISIGACCTHGEIEKNHIIKNYIPILAKGCSLVGSTLIRNRGTIAGNIANNSNCADSVPPLLILDAKLIIQSLKGRRSAALKDFFLDNGKIDIKNDEMITSIEVEPIKEYRWDVVKVGRRKSLAISRLTLAVAVKMEEGILKDLRICCGAVLPTHQRLNKVEAEFKNAALSGHIFKSAADMAAEEVLSITGKRWSSEYKIPVLKELVVRTLEQLWKGQVVN